MSTTTMQWTLPLEHYAMQQTLRHVLCNDHYAMRYATTTTPCAMQRPLRHVNHYAMHYAMSTTTMQWTLPLEHYAMQREHWAVRASLSGIGATCHVLRKIIKLVKHRNMYPYELQLYIITFSSVWTTIVHHYIENPYELQLYIITFSCTRTTILGPPESVLPRDFMWIPSCG